MNVALCHCPLLNDDVTYLRGLNNKLNFAVKWRQWSEFIWPCTALPPAPRRVQA